MKIDRVHAEFVSGNAVSSTVSTHSVVSRDGSGNVHANKFKSANMELTHNAAERSSDTIFYSSDGDIVYKNTAAGMRSSLNFENSAMISATTAATADKIVLRDSYGDIFASNVDVSHSFKINGTALANSATIEATTADTASKIAQRDASGDIKARLFRSDYQNQSTISGGIAYRVSTTDNYIRFCTDMGAVRAQLGLEDTATTASSVSASNNTIVKRHSSGYIFANYFNTTPDDVATGVTKVCVETGNDGYIRHGTSAAISTFLGLHNSATITASTANVANEIVQRNGNGDIQFRYAFSSYLNMSHNTGTNNNDTVFYSSTDNYIRKNNASGFRTSLNVPTRTGGNASGTWAISISGNADTVDSLHAHQFLRSDASDTCTGTLYVSGGSWHSNLGWVAWRALYNGQTVLYADDVELQFYVSIRSHNAVRASSFVATSDERVKTDIQTLDPEIALSKLEKIRPVSYKMKETGQFTFGFIGQEIEKELPNVVNKSDGTLVDFNIMGEFSNKQSIKYQFEDEEKDMFIYTLTLENPIPSTFDVDKVVAISASSVTGNTSGFLYDPEYCGKPEIGGTVMKLLHETELTEEGRYKIIGTETNDFRSLDYNEIFTVTTAALKEVNEQLKAEKIKTATLETKYEELLKRVEALEALQ